MQSVPLWKIILVVLLIAWAVYQVYPSLVWYSLPRDQQLAFTNPEIEQYRERIVQLEQEREQEETQERRDAISIEIAELGRKIDQERDNLKAIQQKAIPLGLDLRGGVHVVLKVDTAGKSETEKMYLVDQVIESLRNRIDILGVREPMIQRQGTDRIVVQIPSITDPAEVLSVIGKTAQLEFRFAKEEEGDFFETYEIIQRIDQALPQAALIEKVRPPAGRGALPWILREDFSYFQEHLFVRDEAGRFTNQLREEVKVICPPGYTLMFGNPEEMDAGQGRIMVKRNLYLVSDRIELTGRYLTDASVQLDLGQTGAPYVAFTLNPDGARIFSRVTGNNIGKYLAIVLDGTVYSAPRIQNKIAGGMGQITGQFSLDDAKLLAVVLRSGALPASVVVEENRTIDPTLGADSVRKGILAALAGSVLVALFMLVYYSFSGTVAIIALLLNMLFIGAALAFIPATLTLPGIAGMILTVGMAVDANVLINERIREEIKGRADRVLALVIDRGFGRAFWAIWDSNITTLVTAVVLFQFGTGPVKGFAVTLSLGIIISMFTAIFVARMIFDGSVSAFKAKRIRIGVFELFRDTKFNFLKYGKLASTISVAFIAVGLLYIVVTGEQNLGVDLTSGSSIRLRFEEPVNEEDIRRALSDQGLAGFTVQKFASEPNELVVRTKDIALPDDKASMGEYVHDLLRQGKPDMPVLMLSDDSVGPTVGRELIRNSIWAIIAASIAIVAYLAIRFELGFAIAAIVAVFHDALFTIGIFCMTNLIPGQHREINLPIIAAILTIMGYSLNDTIVIFDRIRENRRPGRGTFDQIINGSINQTLNRTIITSLTTLITVLALFLFGGASINDFAYTMLIGLVVGSYSTIFIASPIVIWWHNRAQKKHAAAKW